MSTASMSAGTQAMWDSLRGQRGRLVGDHAWSGHSGEIVRLERTLVGYGLVVRLDPASDVPFGQECFLFEPRQWLASRPVVARRRRTGRGART